MKLNQQARRAGLLSLVAAGAFMCHGAVASPVHAQAGTLPTNPAEFQKAIGLSPDQQKKMEAIAKKYQPQLIAIRTKYQPQAQKLQQQAVALQQKMQTEATPIIKMQDKEMEAVLTPAQLQKTKALQAQLRARQQQMMQQQMQGRKP